MPALPRATQHDSAAAVPRVRGRGYLVERRNRPTSRRRWGGSVRP
ncbi:hypothetical protein ACFPRL_26930 [Pseudoclavibacter helvolus]